MAIYEPKKIDESTFEHPCGYRDGEMPTGEIWAMPYSAFRWLMNKSTILFTTHNCIRGCKIAEEFNDQTYVSVNVYYFRDQCLVVPLEGESMYMVTP